MQKAFKALQVVLALFVLLIFAAPALVHLWWVARDKDYYGWPAVTKCRICDKTVWEWQAYDRRQIPVQLENKRSDEGTLGLAVSCGMTGLMHTSCKGLPQAVKVTVE